MNGFTIISFFFFLASTSCARSTNVHYEEMSNQPDNSDVWDNALQQDPMVDDSMPSFLDFDDLSERDGKTIHLKKCKLVRSENSIFDIRYSEILCVEDGRKGEASYLTMNRKEVGFVRYPECQQKEVKFFVSRVPITVKFGCRHPMYDN